VWLASVRLNKAAIRGTIAIPITRNATERGTSVMTTVASITATDELPGHLCRAFPASSDNTEHVLTNGP